MKNLDRALSQRGENFLPLAPALAARKQRDAQARWRGESFDGFQMLARQNLRRRHQRGLRARLDGRRHGEQRDDGLAAAHIALQQAHHAVRRRKVGVDLREHAELRRREPERKLGEDRSAKSAWGGKDASGAAAQPLPNDRQRELVGEELVIGEPRPRGGGSAEIGIGPRRMQPLDDFGEARPLLLLEPARVDPFRQFRHTAQGLRDGFAQCRIGEPGG